MSFRAGLLTFWPAVSTRLNSSVESAPRRILRTSFPGLSVVKVRSFRILAHRHGGAEAQIVQDLLEVGFEGTGGARAHAD